MSKEICKDVLVVRHSKKEEADKEPVFTIAIKTKKTIESDVAIDLKIKSSKEDIFEKYPLNASLEVSLSNPQTQLKV
jgi:hypothetical protein